MEDKLKGFHFYAVRDALFEGGVKVFSVAGSAALWMFLDGKTDWQPNDFDVFVTPGACDKTAVHGRLLEMCADNGWVHAEMHTAGRDSFDVFAPTMRFQIIWRDLLEVIGQFDISVCRVARVFGRAGKPPCFVFEGEACSDILLEQFHVGEHFLRPYEKGGSVSQSEHAQTKERIAKYEARGFAAICVRDESYVSSSDFTAAAYPPSGDEPPSKKRKLDEGHEQDKLREVD
jgi:hypothetical protein